MITNLYQIIPNTLVGNNNYILGYSVVITIRFGTDHSDTDCFRTRNTNCKDRLGDCRLHCNNLFAIL